MRQAGERETQEEKVSMGREQKTEKRPQEGGSRGGVIHSNGYPHQQGCCVFSVILFSFAWLSSFCEREHSIRSLTQPTLTTD